MQRFRECYPRTIEKPLGRWSYEACRARLDQKIDLSNEDHCGPCGQYALTKTSAFSNEIVTIEQEIPNEPLTNPLNVSETHASGVQTPSGIVPIPRLITVVANKRRMGTTPTIIHRMFLPGLNRPIVPVPPSKLQRFH
jgi:hypothetical protein